MSRFSAYAQRRRFLHTWTDCLLIAIAVLCQVSGVVQNVCAQGSSKAKKAAGAPKENGPSPVTLLEAREPGNIKVRPETRDWFDSMRIRRLVFSDDGTRLVTSAHWGLAVWDVEAGRVLFEALPVDVRPIVATEAKLVLFPQPKRPAAVDLKSGTLKDESYAPLRVGLAAHENSLAGSIAPDGTLYAVVAMPHPPDAESQLNSKGEEIGLQPDQIIVADVRTGKVKFRLDPRFQPPKPGERLDPKHDSPKVWSTEFSHDSKYLAACTGDGVVTVWEMNKGEETAVFRSVAPYSSPLKMSSRTPPGGRRSL